MGQTLPSPLILHAEQEHARLRLTVVLLLCLIFALLFFLIRAGLRGASDTLASFGLPLACLLALPLSLALVWGIEQWLKRVWPSGYRLLLDEEGMVIEQPEADSVRFSKGENLNHLGWYFKLRGYKRGGRERRAPESWLCLACQLQQADRAVIVYTYAPSIRVEQITQAYADTFRFRQINPIEVYEQKGFTGRFQPPSRPESIPTQVLSGKDGRYWLAEQRRWREGLELPFIEFELFLDYLQGGW